jgi:long-chain acyl-CoA synthetase
MDYGTVQKRRANFGVGIVEVNKRAGVVGSKYGVGLWSQNRPEWQLTGQSKTNDCAEAPD